MRADAHRAQRCQGPWELEWQVVVNSLMWALRMELRSLEKAAHSFNCWAISLVHIHIQYTYILIQVYRYYLYGTDICIIILYVYIVLSHTYKTYDYIFDKCIYTGQLGGDSRETVIILKSRKENGHVIHLFYFFWVNYRGNASLQEEHCNFCKGQISISLQGQCLYHLTSCWIKVGSIHSCHHHTNMRLGASWWTVCTQRV